MCRKIGWHEPLFQMQSCPAMPATPPDQSRTRGRGGLARTTSLLLNHHANFPAYAQHCPLLVYKWTVPELFFASCSELTCTQCTCMALCVLTFFSHLTFGLYHLSLSLKLLFTYSGALNTIEVSHTHGFGLIFDVKIANAPFSLTGDRAS